MAKLYTVETLSVLFSKHRNTIYLWIASGVFPRAFKVRDGWYVPEGDVKKVMMTRPDEVMPGLEQRPEVHKYKRE